MNPTMDKFGYPATLLRELEHWVILLRPEQVTLGSLVLAAKGNATAYSALPPEAFAEQGEAVRLIERALAAFVTYREDQLSDADDGRPQPAFPRLPRYSQPRSWGGSSFRTRAGPRRRGWTRRFCSTTRGSRGWPPSSRHNFR